MAPRFPRSSPEAQGIASAAILRFVEAADAELDHLHSLMLVRHGAVVAEGWWKPYAPDEPHMLYSLSKSFTATAVGMLVAEGGVALDDKVVAFFPDDLPAEISPNLAAMEVRHLLSMSTGNDVDTLRAVIEASDGNWVRAFLAQPVEHTPGTHFVYNSGATYMLSAIVQRQTGLTLLDYLTPRLFVPLGIEHPTWDSCPRGINTGGWGLNITTEDIAAFGQLYLQQGLWNGRRLLSAEWVADATAAQSDNSGEQNIDWAQGYGYQFWRARHNTYRGDGAFGQFCVVIPDHDAVVAITSGIRNMQSVLDAIWTHLLPAFEADALPEDAAARAALRERLATLALEPPQGAPTSPLVASIDGTRYILDPNERELKAVALRFDDEGVAVELDSARGPYTVRGRLGAWSETSDGMLFYDGLTLRAQPVVAAGAWAADDTFVLRCCMYRTPYIQTFRFVFGEHGLTLHTSYNVSFGPTEFEPITGHAEANR